MTSSGSDSISGKSPAFQFYPNDFISDRHVVLMSMAERGVYITLLCQAWQEPLPNNIDKLARLCGLPTSAFRKLWPAVSVCFTEHGDHLMQPRLERERAKQAEFRRKQSDKGRASAANRKPTGRQPRFNRGSTAVQPSPQPDTQPEGNSSSSSSSSDFSPLVPSGTSVTRTRGMGSGVMAGGLQRDHLRHSWCGERLCVPDFLHGEFVRSLAIPTADADLRAFYAEREAQLVGPVAVDAAKFWRREVAARWPAPESSEGALTSNLRRATVEFLKS